MKYRFGPFLAVLTPNNEFTKIQQKNDRFYMYAPVRTTLAIKQTTRHKTKFFNTINADIYITGRAIQFDRFLFMYAYVLGTQQRATVLVLLLKLFYIHLWQLARSIGTKITNI